MSLLQSILRFGFVYNYFMYILGKFGTARLYIFAKYLPYTPGMKVLDLGCGPGTNTDIFQQDDYLGIDINERYIKKARSLRPNHAFKCGDFLDLDQSYDDHFSLVLMSGLIHHLSDEIAEKFIHKAYEVLKNGGRMVAIENCLHSKQSELKKKIILMDRGDHIRKLNHLSSLINRSHMQGSISIEENLLLIPYTHAIISLQKI